MKPRSKTLDPAILEQIIGTGSGRAVTVPTSPKKIFTALNGKSFIKMGSDNVVRLYSSENLVFSTWVFKYNEQKKAYQIQVFPITDGYLTAASNGDAITTNNTGASNQFWLITDAGSRFVYIENQGNGRVLDVSGSGTADGTKVILYPKGGSSNQKFRIGANPPGVSPEAIFLEESYSKNAPLPGQSARSGPDFLEGYAAKYTAHLYFVPLQGASGSIFIKRDISGGGTDSGAGWVIMESGRGTYLNVPSVTSTGVRGLYAADPRYFSQGEVRFDVYRHY
ncbi:MULTISPECIES: RICIN domain-containing protein [unclassified Pseudomonas]|jgi:hypothetical protein|uniref:RICIN domain-containing protein n=1 Tax=unclassified Pseudomonas TaxID=196821 RepID=UPI000C2FD6EB|nr:MULTISPECIES: RICIN domain-containing protein [unclassified Pseudomonas]MCU1741195.1 RICIN domain-containing protein [Pseudomonas sp. 20S_6.2_Bac1]